MKTILIIGGMGPQASNYAQQVLTNELTRVGKRANIVHCNLVVPQFYATRPQLRLENNQIELLKSIPADTGFIACNTAHVFFDDFQSLLQFKLEHLLNNANLPDDGLVLCSPTSRTIKLFGERIYATDKQNSELSRLIQDINEGRRVLPNTLRSIVNENTRALVFGCTEISLQAHKEGLVGMDTLKITIDKIVNEI